MTIYQPVHQITGARGPRFATATYCCLWIVTQPDFSNWEWQPMIDPDPVELRAA